MPTFIHNSHQPWLENEKIRMIATGFITFAEAPLLKLFHGTSKCHYLLLSCFSTDLGQRLKLFKHLITCRLSSQTSASAQWVNVCQPSSSRVDGQSLGQSFIRTCRCGLEVEHPMSDWFFYSSGLSCRGTGCQELWKFGL